MARVFLSYDRDDAERARRFAHALERAGHEVWWDLHVRGGAQFSKAIEEALRAADAVVVLWSKHSVESAWVRDEAAAGRDYGRLVPVTIDGTPPPLGFRQFQTIDLSRWKGRAGSADLRTLLADVDMLAPKSNATMPVPPAQGRSTTSSEVRRLVLIAATVVALALGAYAGWGFFVRQSGPPVVAIAAADPSARSRSIARDLLVKLGSLESARPSSLELVEHGKVGREPDFIVEAGHTLGPTRAEAQLVLLKGDKRSVLWSRDFESSGDKIGDLKQQFAVTAAQVLDCALEGSAAKLNQRVLKTYLNGCSTFSENRYLNPRSAISTFRAVTQEAPEFVGGWAKLLLAEALTLSVFPDPRQTRVLRAHIATARKVEPHLPEAYLAEVMLLPEDAIQQKATLMTEALKRHPDHPGLLETNSELVFRLGYLSDAIDHAKRAAELDPLSPSARSTYINVLGWAGRRDAALHELLKAERLWPGAGSVVDARFRYHLRYGDPREALKILNSGVYPGDPAATESFLLARMERTPQRIEVALSRQRALHAQEPSAIGHLLQALAEFGREDEMFVVLLHGRGWPASYVREVAFRPSFRRFRRDPRFMLVMKRTGLLDHWLTSGKWPDFCFEADLPYDCKEEAAKLNV